LSIVEQIVSGDGIKNQLYIGEYLTPAGMYTNRGVFIGAENGSLEHKLHFLPINNQDSSIPHLSGLLLESIDSRAGQFRTYGFVEFSGRRRCFPPHERATMAKDEWFEYEEFDGADQYTVTII